MVIPVPVDVPSPVEDEPSLGGPVAAAAALIALALAAAATAVAGIFYLPLWIGGVPVPWTVLLAGFFCWWSSRMGYLVTGSVGGAAVPLVTWFGVTAVIGLSRNGLYLGMPVAVQDWRLYLLITTGVLAGAWSIGGLWARAAVQRAEAERAVRSGPVTPSGPPEL